MTPFGIRKKLKSLLGLDKGAEPAAKPAAPPVPRHAVRFELPKGGGYETQAKQEDTLVLASGRGPQPIATGCADSTCGTCRVEVLEGADQLSAPTDHEENTKRQNGVPAHMRLGCQARIQGPGLKVKIINVFGDMAA
jgi:ferredoxin